MKYKELSNKSAAELNKDLVELRSKAITLRVQNRLSQIKKTHEIGQVRKDIARIMTALTTLTNVS